MRSVFFNLLYEAMRTDQKTFLVIADIGMGLVDSIQKDFPDRFINVGIAEQNMIGVAAGLCNAGFRPFCYTISNFLIHRCFEQIRNDICLHEYPVTLVGTSTGYDNGNLGPTHHVIDDIGCLKILPGINIYSPTSIDAMRLVFQKIMKDKYPAYVRIGKGALNIEVSGNSINHMVVSNPRSDVLLITHGNLLENCIKAAEKNPRFAVYAMNKVMPLDRNELDRLFSVYLNIVVVEDQLVGSGLYSILCQYVVESRGSRVKLHVIAPPNRYEDRVGDKNYFAFKYGFTPEQIANWLPV